MIQNTIISLPAKAACLSVRPSPAGRPRNSKLTRSSVSQRDRAMLHVIEYFAKSLKVIEDGPFESLDTVCYSHSTVNMVISCIISDIKRNSLLAEKPKNHDFFTLPLNSTPQLGGSRRNLP